MPLHRRRFVQLGCLVPLVGAFSILRSPAHASDSLAPEARKQCAAMLTTARLSLSRIELPAPLRPRSFADVEAIHDHIMAELGPRAGFKATAETPFLAPIKGTTLAPLPKRDMYESGATVKIPPGGRMAVEGEIVYRLKTELPAPAQPYSDDEILDAVEALPAMEILWSRHQNLEAIDGYAMVADLMNNGAFILGATIPDWRRRLPENPPMRMTANGKEIFNSPAAPHSAPRSVAPLIWLANEGARRYGGLKAGEIISTGNYTGGLPFDLPADVVLNAADLKEVRVMISAP
jgi:2-keto-4-pentenoate hydratase